MKRILITAGTVYGPLDENKLVGNRVRGVWAWIFAHWLVDKGHEVTLFVPDIQEEQMRRVPPLHIGKMGSESKLSIETHKGFWDYQERCRTLAREHDAAVMAAAVVNWIPERPFPGKMPTDAPTGTIMNIPFVLAPRVIDSMRKENLNLTLIGCKMTIGATEDALVLAAYKTLLAARCNAVVANDMRAKAGLKSKLIVHPDRTVMRRTLASPFEADRFYEHLHQIILDEHYRTRPSRGWSPDITKAKKLFDSVVERYRGRFSRRVGDGDEHVFGAVAVRVKGGALCSPREKDRTFYSDDAVLVEWPEDDYKAHTVHVRPLAADSENSRASLNAPLLLRHLERYPKAAAVLHLHEQLDVQTYFLPNVPTVPYAPPGTARDNEREIPGPVYNIEGHGFIAALGADGEVWKL